MAGSFARRVALLVLALGITAPAASQTIASAYTRVDAKKTCRHTPGTAEEDYGSWRCKGFDGIAVLLGAGDQRMTVSFGAKAEDEPAAHQTLPAFNHMYKGTIEWRLEPVPGGRPRPFATIVRWHTSIEIDAADARKSRHIRGAVLVVTRLGPGGVCHVGYVDGLANPDANALARKIADDSARAFRCGVDAPIILGRTGPGFSARREVNPNDKPQ